MTTTTSSSSSTSTSSASSTSCHNELDMDLNHGPPNWDPVRATEAGAIDDTESCFGSLHPCRPKPKTRIGDTEVFSFSFFPETRPRAPSRRLSSCSLCPHDEAALNSSKLLFSRSWRRAACGILAANIPVPARRGTVWQVGNCTSDDYSDDKHGVVLVMTIRTRMMLTVTMMMTRPTGVLKQIA